MKVIVSESLGLEYAWDVISSCDQNGMQAIADNQNNEILFYDPKNRQYCTNKDLMNADFSIHDVFTDKSARDQVMKPTSGKGFEEFATKWDALQKSDDPDVIKTKNCSMIRFGANESGKSMSSMKGEYTAKIEWTRDFPEFGISVGDSDEVRIRFSEVDALAHFYGRNGLDELIEEKMNEKYPGIGQLDYEDDYIITNEEEMYDYHDMFIGKERVCETFDNSDDWSANEGEIETDVVEGIPNWAAYYIEYGEVVDNMTDEDVKMVDDYLGKLDGEGIRLIAPIEGTENEFNSHPAFGDACDTTDWSCEIDGYDSMNESETNGGTMDLTIIFTHSHYGKKLKVGDERTIKVDLDSAPELYDEDDVMSWIADVASDQVPGGGRLTKYDFEIPDKDANRLIKAVMGDEGFGPDVDVDVDFGDPDSIPSEIPYADALKIYQKMREAYDEHKLNYNKYGIIRKKVVDGVVNDLLKHNSLDDLAEKWFIDYGTMNGWGWKTSFKYSIAYALHEIDKKKHPDEHQPIPQRNNWRGWHEDFCSCGFGSSSDSSD